MSNTILAIWNTGQTGKTESVRNFANELITAYPHYRPISANPLIIPTAGDFRAVVGINKNIIGIESQGDPKTGLYNRLNDLICLPQFKCNLIICTCRTKGETPNAISALAATHGYDIIWTSTYHIQAPSLRPFVNNQKGKHILNLLQSLSLI
jgi:hypothetical protein